MNLTDYADQGAYSVLHCSRGRKNGISMEEQGTSLYGPHG